MTSPITAEERAKALIDAEDEFIKANGMFVGGGTLHRLETSIASVIRQAEDAAIEMAAACCDYESMERSYDGETLETHPDTIKDMILALKSKR